MSSGMLTERVVPKNTNDVACHMYVVGRETTPKDAHRSTLRRKHNFFTLGRNCAACFRPHNQRLPTWEPVETLDDAVKVYSLLGASYLLSALASQSTLPRLEIEAQL